MKLRLFSFITLVFFLSVCAAQSVYAITTLGGNPFYTPPLTSIDDMQNMIMEKQDDVKEGFNKAGYGDLFDAFITQLPNADVVKNEYYKGQTLEWMFYRRGGKGAVRVDKGVLWEGDTPFIGYELYVDHNGDRYTFVVPTICGNIALMAIGSVPPPVVPPPVVVPPEAPPEDIPVVVAPPPVVEEASKFRLLFDVGDYFQLDPANYIFVRGGGEYWFTDNFSLQGLVGGAFKTGGTEGESAFLADVIANYSWSRMFVGAGLGAWITTEDNGTDDSDSDLDIILNFGFRLFGEPDSFNTSLFIEIRSAVDELGDFDLYGRAGAGLRFRF